MHQDDINGIRLSHTYWGAGVGYRPANDAASYWTTTPGSGDGMYGAESFHRQDCAYVANQMYDVTGWPARIAHTASADHLLSLGV